MSMSPPSSPEAGGPGTIVECSNPLSPLMSIPLPPAPSSSSLSAPIPLPHELPPIPPPSSTSDVAPPPLPPIAHRPPAFYPTTKIPISLRSTSVQSVPPAAPTFAPAPSGTVPSYHSATAGNPLPPYGSVGDGQMPATSSYGYDGTYGQYATGAAGEKSNGSGSMVDFMSIMSGMSDYGSFTVAQGRSYGGQQQQQPPPSGSDGGSNCG